MTQPILILFWLVFGVLQVMALTVAFILALVAFIAVLGGHDGSRQAEMMKVHFAILLSVDSVAAALATYFWIVVYSYYRELKDEREWQVWQQRRGDMPIMRV